MKCCDYTSKRIRNFNNNRCFSGLIEFYDVVVKFINNHSLNTPSIYQV